MAVGLGDGSVELRPSTSVNECRSRDVQRCSLYEPDYQPNEQIKLRPLLQAGEGAAAMDSLLTTEECYESAIQLLKERFGDKNPIRQRYFRASHEMQHVKSASDTKYLRYF